MNFLCVCMRNFDIVEAKIISLDKQVCAIRDKLLSLDVISTTLQETRDQKIK